MVIRHLTEETFAAEQLVEALDRLAAASAKEAA